MGGLPKGYRYKEGVMDIEPIPGYVDEDQSSSNTNYMNIPENIQPILSKVKEALSLRGTNTLWSFSWAFWIWDSIDGNK